MRNFFSDKVINAGIDYDSVRQTSFSFCYTFISYTILKLFIPYHYVVLRSCYIMLMWKHFILIQVNTVANSKSLCM